MVGCAMQTVRFLFGSKSLPVSRATLGIREINRAEPSAGRWDTRPTPHPGVLRASGGAGPHTSPGRRGVPPHQSQVTACRASDLPQPPRALHTPSSPERAPPGPKQRQSGSRSKAGSRSASWTGRPCRAGRRAHPSLERTPAVSDDCLHLYPLRAPHLPEFGRKDYFILMRSVGELPPPPARHGAAKVRFPRHTGLARRRSAPPSLHMPPHCLSPAPPAAMRGAAGGRLSPWGGCCLLDLHPPCIYF